MKGSDPSTEWMIRRLTSKGAGLSKKEQAELRKASSAEMYKSRRELWLALVFEDAEALASAFDERADDSDDFSNRQKIGELRHALAAWARGFSKAWKAKEKRAAKRGKTLDRQLPLFGPVSWPTLSADNERAMMRSWPHIDLVADRDGAVLLSVASESRSPWVRRALARVERARQNEIEWNGKLVVATCNKFFAGDTLCLSLSDLLSVGQEGLARGTMDLNPNAGASSTHYVTWISQRIRRAIEKGTLIHVPSWIRDANAAIRRGSTAWQKADKARRKAITGFRAPKSSPLMITSDEHGISYSVAVGAKPGGKAAGAVAFRKALARVPHRLIVSPIDPHEAHKAIQALDGGVDAETAVDLMTASLGLTDKTAEEIVKSGGDVSARALDVLSKATKLKPDTIRKAIAQAPHYVASLDQRGRVTGDDEDDRPAIVLVAEEDDGEAQAEKALLWRQLGEGIEHLCETGESGQEQAEIIRRSYGLEGPEESLTAIASEPLQSTGRTINRNKAKELRTAGVAWLTAWAGEEVVTVTRLSYGRARGHRTPRGLMCARSARRLRSKARRQEKKPSIPQHAIKKPSKRPRKLPPRVHQLREAAAACA